MIERKVRIDSSCCKGCGYCVTTCPKKALSLEGRVNSAGYTTALADLSSCNGCGLCYIVCPDYAISRCGEGDAE